MNKRPLSVTVISYLFVAAGVIGLAYHFTEWDEKPLLEYGLVCLLRFLAILCGVFMLRGANWARWLLLAWMAYHIVLSALHGLLQVVMHGVLFAMIAYFLFRPAASSYFRGTSAEPP
jgi:hypothetical protein